MFKKLMETWQKVWSFLKPILTLSNVVSWTFNKDKNELEITTRLSTVLFVGFVLGCLFMWWRYGPFSDSRRNSVGNVSTSSPPKGVITLEPAIVTRHEKQPAVVAAVTHAKPTQVAQIVHTTSQTEKPQTQRKHRKRRPRPEYPSRTVHRVVSTRPVYRRPSWERHGVSVPPIMDYPLPMSCPPSWEYSMPIEPMMMDCPPW